LIIDPKDPDTIPKEIRDRIRWLEVNMNKFQVQLGDGTIKINESNLINIRERFNKVFNFFMKKMDDDGILRLAPLDPNHAMRSRIA